MEAGWTVSEVGRQPWIVYEKMKVEDAATANTGIWITFIGVVILYVGLGVTTILVLRQMSRRFREGDRSGEADVPYGPNEPIGPASRRAADEREGPAVMATTAAVILFAAIIAYAVFGGADFGAGFWDLVAGGSKRGRRPREVIDHAIAPVWEANHVWLIFVFVLLWTCFPEAYASITLTLFVPLTLAALGIVLRGASFAFRKAVFAHPGPPQLRRRVRGLVGAGALLLRRRGRRHRLGAGPGRGQGGRPVGQLGQPDVRPGRACSRCA